MTTVLRHLVALLAVTAGAGGLRGQPAHLLQGQAAAAQSGVTSLSGTIVDAQSGTPVGGVLLSLTPCADPPSGFPRSWPFAEAGSCVAGRARLEARSGSDGSFFFTADPGQYTLAATAGLFVGQEYGQRVFPGAGRPIRLTTSGLRGLRFALLRSARVSGRVHDSQRPLAGVPVELLRTEYEPLGDRVHRVAGRAMTDERGEYSIDGLEPGVYDLVAGTQPVTANTGAGYPYAYVYYPGVVSAATATRVTVTAGAHLTGLDVVVSPERYGITGTVVAPDGAAASGDVSVQLVALRPDVAVRHRPHPAPVTIKDGTFEIADLAAGDYLVRATAAGGLTSPPVRVTAGAGGSSGVVLFLADGTSAPATVEGRWSVEGVRTRPSRHTLSPCEEGVRLVLHRTAFAWPVFDGEGPEAQSPWLQENGTFAFDGMAPGEYRLHPYCPAPGVYLKEARFDGADVLGRRFVLSAGVHALDVVFSTRAAAVDVTVTSAVEAVAGSRVVLAPVDRERTDLFQSGSADRDGKVRFTGVAPGSYDVMAWSALETRAYFDPAVLTRAAGWTRTVAVAESASAAVTVELVPDASLP